MAATGGGFRGVFVGVMVPPEVDGPAEALWGNLMARITVLTLALLASCTGAGAVEKSAARAGSCAAQGPGFTRLPGTETCLRVGGRVRSEVSTQGTRAHGSDSVAFGAQGRLDLDARTATEYGPLRAFVRIKGGR
jgi:hypothetical protein